MAFPSSPSNDDLHTEYGRTFKYSSATNSWSVATPDAPADTLPSSQAYVDVASLPLSGVVAGSTAFVQDGNKLFMFSGSGWFEIATINTAPTIKSWFIINSRIFNSFENLVTTFAGITSFK